VQFLLGVSHSVGAHSNRLCDADDDSSDVDDDDADHADVADIDSQTESQVNTPETDNENSCGTVSDRINDFARRVTTACMSMDVDV